jgi:uncharacterized membrane protein YeaQ/YmgE (transglycosylase-associated protein family)
LKTKRKNLCAVVCRFATKIPCTSKNCIFTFFNPINDAITLPTMLVSLGGAIILLFIVKLIRR